MSKPIVGYVIDAMRETMLNKAERDGVLQAFKEKHNLQTGDKLTPEMTRDIARMMTDHIMRKAEEQRASEEHLPR